MENQTSKEQTTQVLRRVALISGIVAFILCILLIANYIQVKRVDPLNTPVMAVMLQNLKSNPADDALRNEIRELDLLSRKAFFTSQWQIRTGGYILLICVLIIIICMKWIELIRPKIPPPPEPEKDRFWEHRKTNQRWIIYTGIFLVAGSLILAFLTYNEIGKTISDRALVVQAEIDTATQTKPEQPPPEVSQPIVVETIQENQSGSVIATTTEKPEATEPVKPTPSKTFPSRNEILNNSLTFRGPDGNGVVTGSNYPVEWNGMTGSNIKWKTPVPLAGFNSPVVWKDKVFLSGASNTKREIYCFDATSGKMLWQTDVSTVQGTPSDVPKVDRETGLAAPTLTTDGQRVYAIFATGDLVALDMKGELVWAKNLGMPKNHYGHSSSLIMYRNLLIVQWDQSKGASVKAYAGETGELVWNTPRDVRVSWASPVLVNTGNKSELILAADPYVASYDPATGKELWRVKCIYGEVGPSVAYANGYVFATNEYAKLAAIKLGNPPEVAWELNDYLSDIPSPVANDKYLFLVASYGVIVCYDAQTGEEYWVNELDNNTYASPMLVNDLVYQLDKAGIMHIFKAENVFTSVGNPILGEGSVCTPAFANRRIYIRGDENLYCIGK